MKLVVGLGNPGQEYEKTRHNIGFDMLDVIGDVYGLSYSISKRFNAMEDKKTIDGEKVIFIKPLSYMNLSGNVVKKYVLYYGIDIDDILVIQDDLDMELGKIRILYSSSSGGHNGIKNIIDNLGSKNFTRLKIGISNNKKMDTKDYVLSKFSKEENKILDKTYDKCKNIVSDFVHYNSNELKQIYNGKNND